MKSSLELVYTLLLYVIFSSTSRWFIEETHTQRALPLGAREGGERRSRRRDAVCGHKGLWSGQFLGRGREREGQRQGQRQGDVTVDLFII